MSTVDLTVGIVALLGSALIGGVFFAFSSFVMPALARVPAAAGIAAMQSINVVVINRSFLGVFFATALVSLGILLRVPFDQLDAAGLFLAGGAMAYLLGTFGVTLFANVPLNNHLAAVGAQTTEARDVWQHYLRRWTLWNHVRTTASLLAALLCTLGISTLPG